MIIIKIIIIIIIIVLFKMIFILEPKGACLAFKKDRTRKPFFFKSNQHFDY
jgi:regulator of protease activity HflC (stomatin/prohibitin superfamily)